MEVFPCWQRITRHMNRTTLAILFLLSAGQHVLSETTSSPSEQPSMTGETADQQLFFCTTRIEARNADGKPGSIGTGFVLGEKINEQQQALFIVTCKHVVNGFDFGTISFVASKNGKPDLGKRC